MKINRKYQKNIGTDQTHFYFFRVPSYVEENEISVNISLLPFNESNKSPDVRVLYTLHSADKRLEPATMFDQLDPEKRGAVTVSKEQLLMLTVYKPHYSQPGEYSLQIINPNYEDEFFNSTNLLIICSAFVLLLIVLVIVFICVRKRKQLKNKNPEDNEKQQNNEEINIENINNENPINT